MNDMTITQETAPAKWVPAAAVSKKETTISEINTRKGKEEGERVYIRKQRNQRNNTKYNLPVTPQYTDN